MHPGVSARLEIHQARKPETFQALEDYLEYRKKRHGCPDLGNSHGVTSLCNKFFLLFPILKTERIPAKPLNHLSRSEIHCMTGAGVLVPGVIFRREGLYPVGRSS